MDAQSGGYDCEAHSAEGGNEIDKAQGVDVRELWQDQLKNSKIDNELL